MVILNFSRKILCVKYISKELNPEGIQEDQQKIFQTLPIIFLIILHMLHHNKFCTRESPIEA